MTAQEVHADALTWVRGEKSAWAGIVGLAAMQRLELASLTLTESILTRHAPTREWYDDDCRAHVPEGNVITPWPCPDAQAALTYIEATR